MELFNVLFTKYEMFLLNTKNHLSLNSHTYYCYSYYTTRRVINLPRLLFTRQLKCTNATRSGNKYRHTEISTCLVDANVINNYKEEM